MVEKRRSIPAWLRRQEAITQSVIQRSGGQSVDQTVVSLVNDFEKLELSDVRRPPADTQPETQTEAGSASPVDGSEK